MKGRVHRHHGVVELPLPSTVDEGPRRGGDAGAEDRLQVRGRQRGAGDAVAATAPPRLLVGQPDLVVQIPWQHEPVQPCRRRMADHRAGVRGHEDGETVGEVTEPGVAPRPREVLRSQVDAAPEAIPATTARRRSDLIGPVARSHGLAAGDDA
jgi:hypothetical protein